MRRFLCLLFTLVIGPLFAGQGIITTMDGRIIEGEIEFSNEALLIKPAQGEGITLAARDILRAQFFTNVAVMPKGSGNGLFGVYYAGSNLTGAVAMRLDDAIHFSWAQAPMLGLPHDGFSVRWMGYLEAPSTDQYTFHFGTDDGGRLYLDGQLLADHWQRHDYAETNVTVDLKAGEKRKIKLEYFDSLGFAQARLFWSAPSMPRSLVPRDRLHAASFDPEHQADVTRSDGLLATYFSSEDFTGNSVTRVDPEIDFDWGTNSPPAGIASNRFAVRWTGYLRVTNSGIYHFQVQAGQPMRLFINQRLVSIPWKADMEQTATAMLRAGERCELRLELRATNSIVPVKLAWSGPGFGSTIISSQHLSPRAVIPATVAESNRSSAMIPAGLVLTGGVIVDAPIQSATDSAIQLRGLFRKQALPTAKVTHILVKPLSQELAGAIPKGRTGVLLHTRDFIDGDFAGIQDGRVKIGSVLFGNRTFEMAKEVVAIVLRNKELPVWRDSAVARDGTRLYGGIVSIQPSRIAFSSAPDFAIAAPDLLEVVRSPGRNPQ